MVASTHRTAGAASSCPLDLSIDMRPAGDRNRVLDECFTHSDKRLEQLAQPVHFLGCQLV